jgi:hypothetical protein
VISVKCLSDGCDLHDVDFNILGNPDFVECGACGESLKPFDLRDDPATTPMEVSE